MRRITTTMMALLVISGSAISSADTLIMRDGTRLEGTVTGIVARTITFRHLDGQSRRYSTSEVEALLFVSAERANPSAVSDFKLDAPAGTQLVVKTTETIDSRNAGANQLFSAIVEQEVKGASGRALVPEGSSVQLMIRHITSAEAIAGVEMVLDIQSISINGRRYVLTPVDLSPEKGPESREKRAEAIDRGPDAIGTIIGNSGGGADQIITRGRGVQVSAETVLLVRFNRAVTLQAER